MGEAEDEDEESTEQAIDPRERMLPTMAGQRNFEMDAIGWLIFVVLLVLLIPLLPAVVLVIILARLLGFSGRDPLSWPRSVV